MDNDNLPTIEPHKHNELIRGLGVAKCAKALNITTSYLYSILQGTHRASKTLEARIEALTNNYKADEAKEA